MNQPATSRVSQSGLRVEPVGQDAFAVIGEGRPNSGFLVGGEGVLLIDPRPSAHETREMMRLIRQYTTRPVTHLFLSHCHRASGPAIAATGASNVVAQMRARQWLADYGEENLEQSFDGIVEHERVGAILPNVVFDREVTIFWGQREILLMHLGRGHTTGDAIVMLPDDGVVFGGDLILNQTTPFLGDGYLDQWTATLERFRSVRPRRLVPGRGPIANSDEVKGLLDRQSEYLGILREAVAEQVEAERGLANAYARAQEILAPHFGDWDQFERLLPFNVARAYEEVRGAHPRSWTVDRRLELIEALAGCYD